ncbi:ectoine synthase [Marinomonas sp. 2405UD68-3]|uniref:ectoine synthase n=1 Tax=Marinomonas sp. 2405UD68-3 TaxID=3391835 RepID=UPI0039C9524C
MKSESYGIHFEVVYCVSGKGHIEDIESGIIHRIEPGTCYVLDKHDRHNLCADEDITVLCVFTPPLTGQETHDESGSYNVDFN